VLITGAGGEIGHSLIVRLAEDARRVVITIDVNPLDPTLARLVTREFTGSILDRNLLDRLLAEYHVELIVHLAALLSTRSEFTPVAAHQVNVEGTLNLLEFAQKESELEGRPVIFLYPSSIAAYGLPNLETKNAAGALRENEWLQPTTMYGCNKLYCEQLGRYYAKYYKQLAAETQAGRVDFRCLRFPGLISAVTLPSGGTSDYGPEMLHAAAQGEPVHGDARCGRRADDAGGGAARAAHADGLQRRRVQSIRRRDSRPRAAGISRRANHLRRRQTPAGDRGFLARERG
jgi:nucleoside-diphosphate-sugar epimerase